MTTTPPMTDPEAVARSLSEAQRRALIDGRWNVAAYRFKAAGITEPVNGLPYTCQLAPLGLAVRAILEASNAQD